MAEALYDTPDYFSDYAPQLDAISNRVMEIVADPDIYVSFDFTNQTSEIIQDRKQFPMRQVAFAINKLVLSIKSQPSYGVYASIETGFHHNRSFIESAILVDREDAAYAVRTGIVREDGDILESFSCVHLRKRPIEASRSLIPSNDELIDTFALYTQDKAVHYMLVWILLMKPTGEDLEFAFHHVIDTVAQEEKDAVAMLIQYIRIRLDEENAAAELATRYGTDKPNFQELQDILHYLHS